MNLEQLLAAGEDSRTQFKQNITNPASLAAEMVALTNTKGGRIFIGVADDGQVTGLLPDDIRRLNQMISNVASTHIRNPLYPVTETVNFAGKFMLIVTIEEGVDKPYFDNNGIIWLKSGADKRRVTSKEELRRIFQNADLIHADELPVSDSSVADLDRYRFRDYYEQQYQQPLEKSPLPLPQLLDTLFLARQGELTLGGLLLFGRNPHHRKPIFIIKAVSFFGNHLADTAYRDSEDITGNLIDQYERGMAFLLRNLHKRQKGRSFNSLGQLELSQIALEEVVQNALIHRNYFRMSPSRILIFDNRVEIITPGCLPNNLTLEQAKNGISIIRNPIIASFATKILPFRGLGSGLLRAQQEQPNIEFYNDTTLEEFKVIIPRME